MTANSLLRPHWITAALLGLLLPCSSTRGDDNRLTSRSPSKTSVIKAVAVGEQVSTSVGQRRRVTLPDGSALFVNENTLVKLDQPGRLELARGEVYLEAVAPLTVKTAQRQVSSKQGRFAVGANQEGTNVLVAGGQVNVNDLAKPLQAGQQLAAGSNKAATLPRVSLALGWTRELHVAADSPLVPGSQYAGGSLLARDPQGQEAKLSLRKYHIDVVIEEGFARTTIDQTWFNHEPWQLEGTFYFPLPPDASLSHLAMYVDGNLMQGGMVERQLGREIYETIRYANRDPALLEWVDGSTFKMRVFPIEGRQEKRLILSYTQKLPSLYGELQYRFPAGHSLQQVRDWSFHAKIKGGGGSAWNSSSHTMKAASERGDLLLNSTAQNARTDRDVVLTVPDPSLRQGATEPTFATADLDGERYFMMRLRPDLLRVSSTKEGEKGSPKTWVFLFESSGDRDPLLARVQIEVIRDLLGQAEPGDTFAVLSAGTRVRALAKAPQAITPENIKAAVAFLEGSHLVGALDLGQALNAVGDMLKASGGRQPPEVTNAYLVHVGTGIAAMGERREDVLAKSLPAGTRYVGIGVGKRWSRSFMKLTAERTGGYFTQINPDEPLSWRVFDLAATLRTLGSPLGAVEVGLPPRTDGKPRPSLHYYSRALAPGEELCAIVRLERQSELPPEVLVRFGDGEEVKVPVRGVKKADCLPRQWAKLEIERLLAEDAVKHKESIIALSKAMYVVTPYTSLLVLENEDMYTQFKVERNRLDRWAPYASPQKIPVVYEPDPNQPDPKSLKPGVKGPAKDVVKTCTVRTRPQVLGAPGGPANALEIREARSAWELGLLHRDPLGYRVEMTSLGREQELFLEGLIRARDGRTSNAFRELSTGLPSAGTVTSDLRVPKRGSSFDFSLPPFGGYANKETFEDVHGWPGQVQIRYDVQDSDRPPFPVGEVRITGTAITEDRVIRRMLGVEMGLQAPSGVVYSLGRKAGGGSMKGEQSRKELTASLLYRRPGYSGQDRLFFDLVSYAPGMNTSLADIEAVLEAEAIPNVHDRPGKIDPAARALIEKARAASWRTLTIPSADGQEAHHIVFDGTGRYAWQRTLPLGMQERVVCDGKELLHLYAELGIGARRSVSRFHRLDLAAVVPWAVPLAEDLARGADLQVVAPRTVALVPHGAPFQDDQGKPLDYLTVHLVFVADGQLAERRIVRQPKGEVLLKQTITADGIVRLFDEKGKELAVRQGNLAPAKAPDLAPEVKELVVLPLPHRSREQVLRALKLEKKGYAEMRFAEALPLFAADFAAGNGDEARKVFQGAFHGRDQRQLGFYVLLAACGVNLDAQNQDVLAEHLEVPVAQYLALHSSPVLRKHASQWAIASTQWQNPFLHHLASTHALYQRWQDDRINKSGAARLKTERQRALEYVGKHKGSLFGWAMLCLLQDRAGNNKEAHSEIADAFRLFAERPALRFAASYEQARSLFRAGLHDQARQTFRALYENTLKEDVLPPIDADFRAALVGSAERSDLWGELLRQTATRLIQQKHRPAVLALAHQCWQLEDQPLANQLVTLTLKGVSDEKERVPLTLAVVRFFQESRQLPQADALLQELLREEKPAQRADLWRVASNIAAGRDLGSVNLERLEKALDLEFRQPPEVIDLESVRREYGRLLEHYRNLAEAMVTLKMQPPDGFLTRVVRTADRWRALDQNAAQPCEITARILRTLGDRELGWDYLTTPVALRPNDSEPWLGLARSLRQTGEMELAERAFKAAFESEPTNADILWDRAENLRQAGRTVEAQRLFRQIAEGRWQPRFQPTQARARSQLSGE